MYYNTTNNPGKELKENQVKAQTQTEIVMDYFDRHTEGLSPTDVLTITNNKWPITSIRRAISDLTSDGRLKKTDRKKYGNYGRMEYVWEKVG
jgi:Fe2+ or Zn2+ uptake regulation protein